MAVYYYQGMPILAPYTVYSNEPHFDVETISLKRQRASQGYQRWDISFSVQPDRTQPQDLLVDMLVNDQSSPSTMVMPQFKYVVDNTTLSTAIDIEWDGASTAVIGTSSFELEPLTNQGVLPKGSFVSFSNHDKVYILTEDLKIGTNLLEYSQKFKNTSAWATNSVGFQANKTAPDGSSTAWTVIDNNASGFGNIQNNTSMALNTNTYTFSIFIEKTSSRSYAPLIAMRFEGDTVIEWVGMLLNTNDGTYNEYLNNRTTSGTYSVENYNNDWWRVSVTAAPERSNHTLLRSRVEVSCSDNFTNRNNNSLTGRQTLWGAQLEEASSAGPYITTEATPKTTSTINLYPSLKADITSGTVLKFNENCLLSYYRDLTVFTNVQFTDGLLANPGTINLYEAV